MKLKDKVAIVVGGGSGVGRATSKLLASEGAKVVIADRDLDSGNRVVDEIKAAGGEAAAVQVNMLVEQDAQAMAKSVLEKLGKIDILCNIAGGSMGRYIREKLGPFAESTKAEWDTIFDVNINGARNCTRAVINHMMERRSGKIVCFSSIAAISGVANGTDYAAAKGAVISFTKSLAVEMAPYGVYVNCITPSGVATERIQQYSRQRQQTEGAPAMTNLATPEEVASAVLFLVSDDSNHVSGQNIIFGVPAAPRR